MKWPDRFWSNIEKTETCWNWLGRIKLDGYADVYYEGRLQVAHRVSYKVHVGDIPAGMFVCHRCDNRRCVNPAHLFLGTHRENMADMVRKGRQSKARGEHAAASKLTSEKVVAIREGKAAGETVYALAERYGVTHHAIYAVVQGRNWAHVPASTLQNAKKGARK